MPLPTLQSDLRTRVDALRAELAAMPEHKRGTDWHIDRVNEIHAIYRQLERRETFRPTDATVMPALLKPSDPSLPVLRRLTFRS